jgi:hypothetical protein
MTVYSELITFLCINLIWFIYFIIITTYYYMYHCSDPFCTVSVVIYWIYPLQWIAGILNKWLWLWLWLLWLWHCCRRLQDEPDKGCGEVNCSYAGQGAIPKTSTSAYRAHILNPKNSEPFKISDILHILVRK